METKFKETEIGRIPDDWDVVKLGKLSEVVTGSTPSTKEEEYWGEDIPFITPTDIGDSRTVAHTERYLSHKGATVSRPIPPYSVCVTCIASIGKTCITKTASATNQQINSIIPNEKLSSEYLYYTIVHNCERLKSLAGFTTVPIVKKSSFEKFFVAIPPLAEQRKIAEILSTIDDTIEKTDAVIEETQQLKKGLMQKLFTEGIGHTKFKQTKIGRIPEEWGVVNLSDVFQVIDGDRGVNYPKSNEMLDDGYCVFLNAKNVTKSGFKFDEVQFITQNKDEILGKGKLTRGDLVLTTRGTLGNFAYFNDEVNFENLRINSGMVVLRPLNKILTNYYYRYFNSYLMQYQIERLSFGTAQSQLTVGGIQKFRLLVPPNDEQCKIAEILSEVDAKIETEQAFKAELEQLKKGLMQVLLTGKVRVKV